MERASQWSGIFIPAILTILLTFAFPQTARASSGLVNTYDNANHGVYDASHGSLRKTINTTTFPHHAGDPVVLIGTQVISVGSGLLIEAEDHLIRGSGPEYTHSQFELENYDRCRMWFNTLDGPEKPSGDCNVQLIGLPEVSPVCPSNMNMENPEHPAERKLDMP